MSLCSVMLRIEKIALLKGIVHAGYFGQSAHVPDLGRDAIPEDHSGFVYHSYVAVLIAGASIIRQRASHCKVAPKNLVAVALIELDARPNCGIFNSRGIYLEKPAIDQAEPQTNAFLFAFDGRHSYHTNTFFEDGVALYPLKLPVPRKTHCRDNRLEGNKDDASNSHTVERVSTELHWYWDNLVHVGLCISGHKRLDRIRECAKIRFVAAKPDRSPCGSGFLLSGRARVGARAHTAFSALIRNLPIVMIRGIPDKGHWTPIHQKKRLTRESQKPTHARDWQGQPLTGHKRRDAWIVGPGAVFI
jgi:hypothetical protein